MSQSFKPNNPAAAQRFFEEKLAFTTGPVEVDYARRHGADFNIIDVRAAEDYEQEHVPDAINLPEDRWSTFDGLAKDKLNVLYCYSHVCHLGARAAVEFAKAGYPVMEMDGGFAKWKESELETELGIVRDETPAA